MTDTQILTITLSVVVAIVAPVSALVFSNSRVSDLSKKIDDMEKRLTEKIDNAFEHMKLLLELHEAKHHKD